MCKLAPNNQPCLFDEVKKDVLCCQAAELAYQSQQLRFSIPIIGQIFKRREQAYECPWFLIEETKKKI